METQTHRFVLDDADGTPHEYHLIPLMPSEGVPIMLRLYAMLVGPLGHLVADLLQGDIADMLDDAGGLAGVMDNPDIASNLFGTLKAVEWSKVGATLSQHLADPSMASLCKQLLQGAMRDGQELDNPAVYEMSYRANYWEHNRAVWEAIKINRFFPPLSSFADESESKPPKAGTTSPPASPGGGRVN